MKLACVHMCTCACACVRTRACTTKKIFDQKKFFWPKNLFHQKNPKNVFDPKNFFHQYLFFTQNIFLPKKTKQKHHLCWNIDLTLITWIRFLPSMYSLMSYKTILYGKTLYHIDYMWMDSSQCILYDNL